MAKYKVPIHVEACIHWCKDARTAEAAKKSAEKMVDEAWNCGEVVFLEGVYVPDSAVVGEPEEVPGADIVPGV